MLAATVMFGGGLGVIVHVRTDPCRSIHTGVGVRAIAYLLTSTRHRPHIHTQGVLPQKEGLPEIYVVLYSTSLALGFGMLFISIIVSMVRTHFGLLPPRARPP